MNNISQLEQAIAIPTAIAGDLTQAKNLIDADKKDAFDDFDDSDVDLDDLSFDDED